MYEFNLEILSSIIIGLGIVFRAKILTKLKLEGFFVNVVYGVILIAIVFPINLYKPVLTFSELDQGSAENMAQQVTTNPLFKDFHSVMNVEVKLYWVDKNLYNIKADVMRGKTPYKIYLQPTCKDKECGVTYEKSIVVPANINIPIEEVGVRFFKNRSCSDYLVEEVLSEGSEKVFLSHFEILNKKEKVEYTQNIKSIKFYNARETTNQTSKVEDAIYSNSCSTTSVIDVDLKLHKKYKKKLHDIFNLIYDSFEEDNNNYKLKSIVDYDIYFKDGGNVVVKAMPRKIKKELEKRKKGKSEEKEVLKDEKQIKETKTLEEEKSIKTSKKIIKQEEAKKQDKVKEPRQFIGTHKIESELDRFFKQKFFKSFVAAIESPYKFSYGISYGKDTQNEANQKAEEICNKEKKRLGINSSCQKITNGITVNSAYDQKLIKNTDSKKLSEDIQIKKQNGFGLACEKRLFLSTIDEYNKIEELFNQYLVVEKRIIKSIYEDNFEERKKELNQVKILINEKRDLLNDLGSKTFLVNISWWILEEYCYGDKKKYAKNEYKKSKSLYKKIKYKNKQAYSYIKEVDNKLISSNTPKKKKEIFNNSIDTYVKMAEKGNPESQYIVGWKYLRGEGLYKDPYESFKWFIKAANQSHSDSSYALGWMHYIGDGVEKNKAEGMYWFKKSAKQGNIEAKDFIKSVNKKESKK